MLATCAKLLLTCMYLYSCGDKEISEHRLHFGLPRLEVISTQKDVLLLRQLHRPGHKRVLGGAIDVRALQRVREKVKGIGTI